MSNLKVDKWLNPDGTENYKCRAWVNFNGTGMVAIRASGNVSSITDSGVGLYTVNFSSPMPDAAYSAEGTAELVGGVSAYGVIAAAVAQTASACPIRVNGQNGATTNVYDSPQCCMSVFR